MTLSRSNPRAKSRWLLLAVAIVLGTLLAATAALAVLPGGTSFEGNDGNLQPSGSNIDWNSFVSSAGVKSTLGNDSKYVALTDDTGNSDGSIFTKSTKNHSYECPNVGSGSMGGGGNKDDLARMYLATQNINNNVYLYLAWVRVYPQNSTTAAANLSFEFNQASATCATAVAGQPTYTGTRASHLPRRSAGDMLVLYDFAGGSTEQGSGNPQIQISRWLGAASPGSCEVSNETKPCWGTVQLLNANQAEARVNDASIGPVFDAWVGHDIGTVAFGEASINLTAAGVFQTDPTTGLPTTCASFGSALGISRSSGNSITSSLSDYIGPAQFTLANCGSVTIRKQTSPPENPAATSFSFTNNLVRLPPGSTDATIGPLKHGESTTFTNVRPGTALRVTESDPGSLYALSGITCTPGSTATNRVTNATNATVNSVPARTVQFDLAAGQSIDCTFTNQRQKLAPALSTDPWIYANDTATVTANAAFTDIDGSVAFKLYGATEDDPETTDIDEEASALANCQANVAQGLLYSQTVGLADPAAAAKSASTTNSSVKIEGSQTVYWRVEYSGDDNHLAWLSDCVENIAVTLNGDPGPGVAPPTP